MLSGKLIEENEILTRHWLTLKSEIHQLGNNKHFDFTIVNGPDWTMIVPLTKDNKFLMVRQYRPGWREISLEFPAGRNRTGESFLEAAQRELVEETGYQANSWTKLLACRPIVWSNQTTKFFVAKDLTFVGQDLDEEEDIEVAIVDPKEFMTLYKRGEIMQQATLLAYFSLKTQISDF